MPYARIEYNGLRRIILSVYEDDQSAINDLSKKGSLVYIDNINEYVVQTVNWNKMVALRQAGIKLESKKKDPINWNYDLISEEGKKAISEALKNSTDSAWMVVMYFHNEEKWSNKDYCCSILLPQFKEEVNLMMNKISKK